MTAQPLVSIGMAVHNSEATLASAIQSLMNQTYTNWELLLADDGSSDSSLAIARSFNDPRIRIFADGENRGLAKRLNELVAVARGELFARMDADDIAYPERFARQVAFLAANPEVDLLGTSAIVFNGHGEPVSLMRCRQTHDEICRRPWNGFNDLIHPTWVARTRWFRQFPFNTTMRRAQDREILLRAYRSSRFACLPEVLLGYRQERLTLNKILRGRAYFVPALGAAAVQHRDPRFLYGIATQFAKAAVDIVAIGTGLNYKLLRHRKVPVPAETASEWAGIWREVMHQTASRVGSAGSGAHWRSRA